MPIADIVVVAHNSAGSLRDCVMPLVADPQMHVLVVDNASTDAGVATVADLPVAVIEPGRNLGFGAGCNVGWRSGEAPFVVFLNPDARIHPGSVRRLVEALEVPAAALAAPQIHHLDGTIQLSQHRFPTLLATSLQAVFMHRVLVRSAWANEDVVVSEAYQKPGKPEWVGGACIALRRETLERLDGFDERFFMYCEDMDLCRRARDLGLDILYVPEAEAQHEGGASASAPRRSAMQVTSRVLYAHKHRSKLGLAVFTAALSLGLFIRVVFDPTNRAVHVQGLRGVRDALSHLPN